MAKNVLGEDRPNEIIEELAAIEHERWSHWQRYLHQQCRKLPDGSLVIPTNLVEQWERQLKTSYSELNDEEKQSDRDQVLKYLPRIVEYLKK